MNTESRDATERGTEALGVAIGLCLGGVSLLVVIVALAVLLLPGTP